MAKKVAFGHVQDFPIYGGLGMSAPSLHRESTNSLILSTIIGGSGPVLQQRMLLLWGKHVNDVILPEAWVLLMLPNNHFAWRQVRHN